MFLIVRNDKGKKITVARTDTYEKANEMLKSLKHQCYKTGISFYHDETNGVLNGFNNQNLAIQYCIVSPALDSIKEIYLKIRKPFTFELAKKIGIDIEKRMSDADKDELLEWCYKTIHDKEDIDKYGEFSNLIGLLLATKDNSECLEYFIEAVKKGCKTAEYNITKKFPNASTINYIKKFYMCKQSAMSLTDAKHIGKYFTELEYIEKQSLLKWCLANESTDITGDIHNLIGLICYDNGNNEMSRYYFAMACIKNCNVARYNIKKYFPELLIKQSSCAIPVVHECDDIKIEDLHLLEVPVPVPVPVQTKVASPPLSTSAENTLPTIVITDCDAKVDEQRKNTPTVATAILPSTILPQIVVQNTHDAQDAQDAQDAVENVVVHVCDETEDTKQSEILIKQIVDKITDIAVQKTEQLEKQMPNYFQNLSGEILESIDTEELKYVTPINDQLIETSVDSIDGYIADLNDKINDIEEESNFESINIDTKQVDEWIFVH